MGKPSWGCDHGEAIMQDLMPLAARVGSLLAARRESVAVAESSAGGLIAASLLSVPGASAFMLGGAVLYTSRARVALLGITPAHMQGLRPATEDYARLLARTVRERLAANWGLGESGATGPGPNRYGDPPGHCCGAICGGSELALTLATGSPDRMANMRAFAGGILQRFVAVLEAPG